MCFRNSTLGCAAAIMGLMATGMTPAVNAGDIEGGSSGIWTTVNGVEEMAISGPRKMSITVAGDYYDGPLPDGSYRYELTGQISVEDDSFDSKRNMNNGRSEAAKAQRSKWGSGVIAFGHFRIKNGVVFEPGNGKEK